MSTLEPLDRLEALIWELCPHLKNVRVIIQDLDRLDLRADSMMFHREPVAAGLVETMPVVLHVVPQADLPLAIPGGVTVTASPGDLAILRLVEASPGLKGAAIARRLGLAHGTVRERLGRLARRRGWLTSSSQRGYTLTEAGRLILLRNVGTT